MKRLLFLISLALLALPAHSRELENRKTVEGILKAVLADEPRAKLLDEKELFNDFTHLAKTRSFVFGDFNSDGKRDVAICAERPEPPSPEVDGLFVIATKKAGKWILVYRQKFVGLSLPGLKWHPKKRELFFFGSFQGHELPRHVQWDPKGGSYFMAEVPWKRLGK